MRIIVADDHTVVRQGVAALLEKNGLQVVAEASNGQEAVTLACKIRPDVVLLDFSMPIMNGLEAAREIRRLLPEVKIVLLTVFSEDRYVLECLRAGVNGYVLKTRAVSELLDAIHEVFRGNTYLSASVSRCVVEAAFTRRETAEDPLSARERQVLQLVAEGKSTKDVAVILGVSVKTAESHRTRLMDKLNIHETASLVRYAIRRGVIEA